MIQEFLAMAEKMVTQKQHDELIEALNDLFSNVSTMIKVLNIVDLVAVIARCLRR
ncbi:hypothetical protein Hanom_Chr12g01117201 [Helianthus anomalus]